MKKPKIKFKKLEPKKIVQTILLLISIFCITSIIFIGTFSSLLFNKNFYDNTYKNSGAYNNFNKETIDNRTNEIFLFFQNKGSLDNNFYSENEISHMQDVKSIIKQTFKVYYISLLVIFLIYFYVYKTQKEVFILFLMKSLFFSGIVSLILIALFLTMNFTSLFENFHKIFFTGNYTFSSGSNIIRLFSQDFFMIFGKTIFFMSGIKSIILSLIGFLYLNKKGYF